MRFCKLVLAVLGVCGLAKANECSIQYDDPEINNAVRDIAVEFNIEECQAFEIYDFVVKGNLFFENAFAFSADNKLTVSQCQKRCKVAKIKYESFLNLPSSQILLKALPESISANELYEKCLNDCKVLPEMLEHEVSENGNPSELEKTLSKRAGTCDDPKKGKINLVESNYQNGVPRYQQDKNSVRTAISEVNGCGPKLFNKYNVGEAYKGLFLPACNCHDVCYDCQKGKSNCDKTFLSNLKKLCDTKYKTKKLADKVLHAECYAAANIMYKAVDLLAGGSYKRCGEQLNSSTKCAFCGTSVVKNTLVKSNFYIKK